MIESVSHNMMLRSIFSSNGVCKAYSDCALIPNVLRNGVIVSALYNFECPRVLYRVHEDYACTKHC